MDRPTGREAYRAARDMLLRHRDDYDAAIAAFRWPDVGDRFNWVGARLVRARRGGEPANGAARYR